MNFLSLREVRYSLLCLIIFFAISNTFVNAAEIIERSYSDSEYSETFDSNEKDPLLLDDSVFASGNGVTLKGLITKVSLIVVALLIGLGLVKFFLARNKFDKPGSLLDEFTQKITGGFSSFSNVQGLKLKQTLILAPGQNVYLVEVEGKKLLLGATHNGGVQFLADLSPSNVGIGLKPAPTSNASEASLVQIPKSHNDVNNQFKHVDILARQEIENPFLSIESVKTKETFETNGNNVSGMKQEIQKENKINHSLKRRTNFRQSLNLANVK